MLSQRPDGSWDQAAHESHNFKSDCIPFVNTAFALWFFSSLTDPESTRPLEEARAAKEKGEPPADLGAFRNRLLDMLEDIHRPLEQFPQLRLKNDDQRDNNDVAEVAEHPLDAPQVQQFGKEIDADGTQDAHHDAPRPQPLQRPV